MYGAYDRRFLDTKKKLKFLGHFIKNQIKN